MTRDDLIRIAREAGVREMLTCTRDELERFATLVATFVADRMIRNGYRKCAEGQRETQFCGQLEAAVAGAIAAEREACAKVADDLAMEHYKNAIELELEKCAGLIRARGS